MTRRERSLYQLRWIKRRRAEWFAANGPCAKCGSWLELEADHIDPATKLMEPARLWSMAAHNPLRVAELEKLQVLCHECHAAKTAAEQEIYRKPLIHGTSNAYKKKGCRCVECVRWRREYAREKRWRAA